MNRYQEDLDPCRLSESGKRIQFGLRSESGELKEKNKGERAADTLIGVRWS